MELKQKISAAMIIVGGASVTAGYAQDSINLNLIAFGSILVLLGGCAFCHLSQKQHTKQLDANNDYKKALVNLLSNNKNTETLITNKQENNPSIPRRKSSPGLLEDYQTNSIDQEPKAPFYKLDYV